MRTVEVHLVRHGQSTWNVQRRLQGQTAHPPLTEQGRADAARAAEALLNSVGGRPVRIDSSDLERAAQTAHIIAARFAPSLDVRHTAALREQHLGSLQGRLTSELTAEPVRDGEHISEVRWGGGESLADVHSRLREYFSEVLPTAPDHLIVVTHGDTLRVARAVLAGKSHRDVEWDVVDNGAVLTVVVTR
ncbi:histidine phosphatase family protein [Cumulibacter soli]|uniref:histidine phosphatase family protein n=1 Tax=Cumulibacter soli TaxID=2546344 RepID=UPI001067443E|nr:histidine phosphatase family protein [Cumulibacter soli]